jgi:hypothetical protein
MTAYCSELLIIKENNHKLISSPPDTIIPILIGKGSISNPSEYYGTNMIIKTTTEWEYLKKNFSELYMHIREKEIDFSIYQIIAIIEGGSSSSTIDITNVIEYPDSIVIHISNLIKSIANDSAVLFHIVKIPVSKKEIIFKYDDRVERRNKGIAN